MKTVAYIRMSTASQKDSPEKQKAEINRLAKEHGHRVSEWYEDHGVSGTTSNRPEFQRLLKDAKAGKFTLLFLWESSRLSRENVLDVLEYYNALHKAGVKVITTQRGVIDPTDIGGLLTLVVDTQQNRQESVTRGKRCTEGRIRSVSRGTSAGVIPFGCDKISTSPDGTQIRTSFREKFAVPKGWTSKLVLTANEEDREALLFIFESIADGVGPAKVAQELCRAGSLEDVVGNGRIQTFSV